MYIPYKKLAYMYNTNTLIIIIYRRSKPKQSWPLLLGEFPSSYNRQGHHLHVIGCYILMQYADSSIPSNIHDPQLHISLFKDSPEFHIQKFIQDSVR